MKHIIFISAFILINVAAFAQSNFGVKLDLGISKTWDDFQYDYSEPDFKFMPSGNAGIFYTKDVGSNSIIGAELLIMHKGAKILISDPLILPSNLMDTVGTINFSSKSNVTSLALPLYYGYKFNKFIPNIGILAYVPFYEKYSFQQVIDENGVVTENQDKSSQSGLLGLFVGPRIGLFYQLTEQVQLESNYNISLKVMNTNFSMFRIYQQQLTIGIRYNLTSNSDL